MTESGQEPNLQEIPYTVHIFREGGVFVAHAPELDISSCGATAEQARTNIREAVRGFAEVSAEQGTLTEILQEAGYTQEGGRWQAPEFISLDRTSVSLGR